jgi:hypothetical protein
MSALRLFATSCLLGLTMGCDGGAEHTGHAPLPQVHDLGGPLLTAPKIVTVTFAGDALAADLEAFGQSVASSAWWNAIRAGYCGNGACVGDGPAGASVELSTAAAASYTDSAQATGSTLQTWLAGAITGGALPAAEAGSPSNTLYVIYFPSTTTIDFEGTTSCVSGGFGGYHNSLLLGSQVIVYAVVVECSPEPSAPSVPALSVFQNTTFAASHENR